MHTEVERLSIANVESGAIKCGLTVNLEECFYFGSFLLKQKSTTRPLVRLLQIFPLPTQNANKC